MLGAIAGDVIGSVHEFTATKSTDFALFVPMSRFTDDTVLAVAVADCIMNGRDYVDAYHEYANAYPKAGYGAQFRQWFGSGSRLPYNSFGNGSAMRVPAVGFAFDTLDEVLQHAKRSAEVTHNHPEGIKGAQATAAAIFMARRRMSKQDIKTALEQIFAYDLGRRLDDMRPGYTFDESCQGTVPQALVAFFESSDYEDAVRKSVSLGGDADTLACITGAVAEAHYRGVPAHIAEATMALLDDRLRQVVTDFRARYVEW